MIQPVPEQPILFQNADAIEPCCPVSGWNHQYFTTDPIAFQFLVNRAADAVNLVTNPNFATDGTGWTDSGVVYNIGGQGAWLQNDGSFIEQSSIAGFDLNDWFELRIDVNIIGPNLSGGLIRVTGITETIEFFANTGTYLFYVQPIDTSETIRITAIETDVNALIFIQGVNIWEIEFPTITTEDLDGVTLNTITGFSYDPPFMGVIYAPASEEIAAGCFQFNVAYRNLLRIPTEAEWDTERLSWGSNNAAGAFGSPLKLSMGGSRSVLNGALNNVGSLGLCWCSTVSGAFARYLNFSSGNAQVDDSARAVGRSVRLIVEGTFTQEQFDDNYLGETIEIEGLTYGYVYNPTTQKIWLDRNLGATQIALSSTDADSYGWLYQWGRLTDGHQIRTPAPATTATLSSTDVPGNDSFITIGVSPFDWRDPQNDNLWQGVDGINNPAPEVISQEWVSEPISLIPANICDILVGGCSQNTMYSPVSELYFRAKGKVLADQAPEYERFTTTTSLGLRRLNYGRKSKVYTLTIFRVPEHVRDFIYSFGIFNDIAIKRGNGEQKNYFLIDEPDAPEFTSGDDELATITLRLVDKQSLNESVFINECNFVLPPKALGSRSGDFAYQVGVDTAIKVP